MDRLVAMLQDLLVSVLDGNKVLLVKDNSTAQSCGKSS